ncbi:MAG: hypothetical protein JNM56_31625 [Planctomycetia bacterium]|nr:hypothetical protein [Planctomycetia bacterium]
MAELRTQADQLARTIAFNQRNVGDTPEDHEETAKLIKELRDQRNTALAELKALEAGQARTMSIPTKEETRQLLSELDQMLMAATSNTEANAGKARAVIKLLTGGRINLYQQGERRRHGGWLQGRFSVRLLYFLANQALGMGHITIDTGAGHPVTEVVIDYRDQTLRDWESQRAKDLCDQGLMNKEIAARLGCGRNWVTKLLQGWFGKHGQPLMDGRQRRSTLLHKQMKPSMYAQLADQAKELWDQGWPTCRLRLASTVARPRSSPPWNTGTVPVAWSRPVTQPGVPLWWTGCGNCTSSSAAFATSPRSSACAPAASPCCCASGSTRKARPCPMAGLGGGPSR